MAAAAPQSSAAESITLRPATRADLPTLVAMRDTLNDLERAGCPHGPILRMTLEAFTAVWGPTIDSPTHCWRIVEQAGRPIGFGLIYLIHPPTQPPGAFIHWAYLAEGQRQQGTGRRLFDELAGWARQQGAQRIELQFIEGNEIAQRFWHKVGFRPYAQKCVHYL